MSSLYGRFASDAAAPEIDPARVAALAATPEEAAIEMELLQALTDFLGELKPADREVLLSDSDRSTPASATSRKRRQRALGRDDYVPSGPTVNFDRAITCLNIAIPFAVNRVKRQQVGGPPAGSLAISLM